MVGNHTARLRNKPIVAYVGHDVFVRDYVCKIELCYDVNVIAGCGAKNRPPPTNSFASHSAHKYPEHNLCTANPAAVAVSTKMCEHKTNARTCHDNMQKFDPYNRFCSSSRFGKRGMCSDVGFNRQTTADQTVNRRVTNIHSLPTT